MTGTKTNTTLDGGGVILAKDTTTPAQWGRIWDGLAPQRYDCGLDYDPVNGVYVMFGGIGSPVVQNETWTHNPVTNKWNNTGAQGPVVRYGAPLVYDPIYGVFVFYGGTNNVNETWTFNVSNNTWTQITTINSPQNRRYHGMAYDSVNNLIVLFGGYSFIYSTDMNDTWTFSLSNNTWTNMSPANAPPRYNRFPMAFDAENGVMVAFVIGQTWTYNVSNNTWTNMNPISPPSSRQLPGFHYNPLEKVMVMFGGLSTLSDTWTYNVSNNTWTNMLPLNSPTGRTTTMEFNPVTGEMFIYSGMRTSPTPTGYLQEMWSYNYSQNTWWYVNASGPQWRNYCTMGYNPTDGTVVLFGGYATSPSNLYLNDTWTFNTTTKVWTNVTSPGGPGPRMMSTLAYDPDLNLIVLFGGYGVFWTGSTSTARWYNDTWTFNTATNAWTNMTTGNEPSMRRGHMMEYDPQNHMFVMFGGFSSTSTYLNDTWLYSIGNNTWTNTNIIPLITGRYWSTFVYDQEAKAFILHGGYASSNNNQTWLFNITNSTWTNINPLGAPQNRYYNAFSYDNKNKLVVVFGGMSPTTWANDTWAYSWANNTWFKVATTSPPPINPQRMGPRMVWQQSNGQFFHFGGSSMADAWTLQMSVKYYGDGSYTSNAFDSGGQSYFGTLEWNSTLPSSTTVQFQFRTANDSVTLSSATFVGPDGTANTYYTSFPVALNSVHNDSRWFQYIACFNSTNSSNTPRLEDVTVKYNRVQTVSVSNPVGGEKWNDTRTISWTGSDPDGDTVTYDINAMNTTTGVRQNLVSGLAAGTTSWDWNTNITPNGTYWIEVISNDTNPTIPVRGINSTSGAITVFHSKQPTVKLSSPANSALIFRSWANLTWVGTDAEGDALGYYVYFSTDAIDTLNPGTATAYTANSYFNVTGLINGSYNWTVIPEDPYQKGPIASPRMFTIDLNNQPMVTLFSPPSGITRYRNWANLTWTGNDGDSNPITYSIFLTTGPIDVYNPGTPLGTTTNTWYNATGIVNGSYNWTIRGNDGKEDGPAPAPWHFNMSVNTPPTVSLVSPADGGTSLRSNVTLTWAGNDGQGDVLYYYVLLSTTPINLANLPAPVANVTTSSYTATNLMNGTYYWTVVPCDRKENGTAPTPYSFIVAINRPPTATLKSPTNSSIVYRDWTFLNWSGADGDENPVTYYVLLSSIPINLASPPAPVAAVTTLGYNASGLVNGTYYWTVVPNDGKENGTAPDPWRYNSSLNGPPTVTMLGPSNNGNVYTSSVTFTWEGGDLDGDPIKYFVIISLTSINLAKPPTPDATVTTTNYSLMGLLNGTYYWTIIPNDGKENGTTSVVWKFSVKLNRAPTVAMLFPDDKSMISGTHVGLKWQGNDPEGDSLNYYILYSTTQFDVNSLPTPIATTKDPIYTVNDLEDGATYYWAIIANDGKVNSTVTTVRMFMVGTPSTNHPPTVTLSTPTSGSTVDVLNPGFVWTFHDDEGDNVTFDIFISETRASVDAFLDSVKVAADISVNSFTVTSPLTRGKTYYWTVVPFDSHTRGSCTSGTWYFKVSDYATINNPPTITSKAPTGEIDIGTEWTYEPTTKDIDVGDRVTLKILSGPDGMVLEDGTMTWIPTEDQVGTHMVTLEASDGKGSTLQSFTITVKPGKPNNPPRITAIADRTLEVGGELLVQISATDIDNDVLMFRIDKAPKGLKVDSKGLITWSPVEADIGTAEVQFSVSDGKETVSSSFNVTVNDKGNGNASGVMAGFPWWILILLVVIVVMAVVVVAARRKKGQVEQPAGQTAPAPGPVAQVPVQNPQAAPTQVATQPMQQGQARAVGTGLRPVPVMRPRPVASATAYAVQPLPAMPLPPPPLTPQSSQIDIILQEEATDVITDAIEAIEDARSIGKDVTRAEATMKVASTYYEKENYKKAIEYGRLVYHVIE